MPHVCNTSCFSLSWFCNEVWSEESYHTQQWCHSVLEYTCTSLQQGEKLNHWKSAKTRFSGSVKLLFSNSLQPCKAYEMLWLSLPSKYWISFPFIQILSHQPALLWPMLKGECVLISGHRRMSPAPSHIPEVKFLQHKHLPTHTHLTTSHLWSHICTIRIRKIDLFYSVDMVTFDLFLTSHIKQRGTDQCEL